MLVRRLRRLIVAVVLAVLAGTLTLLAGPAALALDAPGNASPTGAQTGIPTFSWDRVAGATTYDFQISTSDQFTSTVVSVTTVQHQYVPKIQLPTGTQLYWRVRATGGGESWTTTPFSRTTVGAPTLIGPADGAELTQPQSPVTLSWEPVAGAASYDVQYGTDASFVDQTTTKNVKSSSYVVALQTPGTYVWRVRGVLANGVFTAWSGGADPLPRAPSYVVKGLANDTSIPPTSPPDDPNQALTDVVLDWEPITGAKSYQLQISTDRLFPAGTIVDQVGTVYGTRYSPPKTLGNDQYFWRIRATDAAGFQPDWASRPVWRFKRTWPDQPTLLYPSDGATNVENPFYFQWTPVERASSYVVQISSGAGFPTPAPFTSSCTTVHTTLVYGDGPGNCWPTVPGTYSWRVTARDEFGNEEPVTDGISAQVNTFTYRPQLVTTTGPTNGSVFADPYDPDQTPGAPTLTWDPVAGADKYRLTISGSASLTVTTAALGYTPRDLPPGNYSWDVQTVDALGSVGAGHSTGQRTFQIKPLPMVPDPDDPSRMIVMPVPDPLPPAGDPNPTVADLGSSYRFPSLSWQPVSWVDHYELYVARAGGAFTRVSGEFAWAGGDDTGTSRLAPGRYQWYVQAVRKDGDIHTGRTGSFTIAPLPDIPATSYKAALNGNALTGNTGAAVDTCDLKLPSNCQNLRATPVLGWDSPDANVGHYVEVLSKDAELTNIIEVKDVVNTMYLDRDALADSQAGSAYFVVLLPCVVEDVCSSLTHATHSFNKLSRPATLVSPRDGAQVQNDVTLTWDDYLLSQRSGTDADTPLARPGQDEAEYYNVQTAADQNFTQTVTTTKVDQTTFTSFADTYPEGTTWWRVQAVDRNGNALAWSAPRSFVKRSPVPQLLLPADGATVPGDYTLSWAAQPYAATYDIEVYKGGDTSGNTVNRVINASTDRVQYVLTNLDPSSGPYTWRVRRHDGKGRPGDWSAFRVFSVTRPGVTLISPVDNDATVSPADQLFQWQPVQGATSYRFERRRGTSGSASETVDTPSTRWAPTSAVAGGSWQWRVTAYDTAGNLIADSSWLHPFTVTDTPVVSVPVSISGRGVVDSTLTLNPAQWNMPDDTLSITYQWYRGTSAVTGATGLTYAVTSADVGKAITVRATAKRPGYIDGTSTSNAISIGQADTPQATVPVKINGTGVVGSTLQLTAPTWDVSDVTTTYQWFRGTSAASGRTGSTYAVEAGDVGKVITVVATATKAGYGTGTSTSNAIQVANAPAVAPTRAPGVVGSAVAKQTLTADPGDWPGAGTNSYAYQWLVNGAPVSGATSSRYVVRTKDAGLPVSVQVTMTRTGSDPSVATSAPVTVALLASSTTATLAKKKILQKEKGVVTVEVDLAGYDVALGSVEVRDKGKVVGSATLSDSGKVTIKLKKLKKGKHKLSVAYLGSVSTVASSGPTLTLKVVKPKKKKTK